MKQMSENKKLSFDEIKELMKELGIKESQFGHQDISDDSGFGELDIVEEEGGHEGGGETCHIVYHFKDHDVYIKWDGWYYSGEGSGWENEGYEVKPKLNLQLNYVQDDSIEDQKLKEFVLDFLTSTNELEFSFNETITDQLDKLYTTKIKNLQKAFYE